MTARYIGISISIKKNLVVKMSNLHLISAATISVTTLKNINNISNNRDMAVIAIDNTEVINKIDNSGDTTAVPTVV